MTNDELEDAAEEVVEIAQGFINDSDRFTRAESVHLWRYVAHEAESWSRLITSEMDAEDEESGGEG